MADIYGVVDLLSCFGTLCMLTEFAFRALALKNPVLAVHGVVLCLEVAFGAMLPNEEGILTASSVLDNLSADG